MYIIHTFAKPKGVACTGRILMPDLEGVRNDISGREMLKWLIVGSGLARIGKCVPPGHGIGVSVGANWQAARGNAFSASRGPHFGTDVARQTLGAFGRLRGCSMSSHRPGGRHGLVGIVQEFASGNAQNADLAPSPSNASADVTGAWGPGGPRRGLECKYTE